MKLNKGIKILLWIIGILIAIPVILVATLPLWLGPIARPIVNVAVDPITQTSFDIDHLYLNPYTGRFEMRELKLGNPQGYDAEYAVAISNLAVDVAMKTLGDKYVHVEDVVVEGVYISYLDGGENDVDNFTQIQYNVAGGKEKFEEKQAKAKAEKAESKEAEEARAKAEEEAEKAKLDAMSDEEREAYERQKEEEAELAELKATKFVIDHVLIRDVSLRIGMVTIPIPTIELNDLGKEDDGVDAEGVLDAIWKAILKSACAIGDGAKALGGMLGDGAMKAAGLLGDGASALGDGAKAAGEGAVKAINRLGGALFGK